MDHSRPRGVGDGIRAARGIELVDDSAHMEFGRVDRYSQTPRNIGVARPFGQKR
jgi:hypothetical protein